MGLNASFRLGLAFGLVLVYTSVHKGFGDFMAKCEHRWSVIKRWADGSRFYVIERCRRCDTWKRNDIDNLCGDIVMSSRAILANASDAKKTDSNPSKPRSKARTMPS